MAEIENKRNNFRIYFDKPLCAKMSIIRNGDKEIKSQSTYVCINDISAGGLAFTTRLKLPIKKEIVYSFTPTIFSEEITFKGFIIREITRDCKGICKYGISFITTPEEDHRYFKLFNDLSVTIRRGLINSICSVCSREEFPC